MVGNGNGNGSGNGLLAGVDDPGFIGSFPFYWVEV